MIKKGNNNTKKMNNSPLSEMEGAGWATPRSLSLIAEKYNK